MIKGTEAMDQPPPGAQALLTDLYELTMAYGYWKAGLANREAVFHLHFRKQPFQGGFTIACGLADCIRYLREFRFAESDLVYLADLRGNDGKRLFAPEFLDYLGELRLTLDAAAVPEGTVVFPQEPLLRIRGPILQAQLVETALLNLFNFQSLVATKAARVCLAAAGDPVVEFGLRRAQGVDGALTASRAAYVGGCVGTSNVLAGKLYGIPVKGTHAHSWVMAFEHELDAFNAYADALPNNCIFLVDTFESLAGVRHAVQAGERLRKGGHRLIGIRLDSGDLAALSIQARKILDAAGFKEALILGSNDLNEHVIARFKRRKARIDMWGVGTELVTAYDQPALGCVYKLTAIRDPNGSWAPRIKLSNQAAKVTNPGVLQVRRFRKGDQFIGDAIYDETRPLPSPVTVVDVNDATRRKRFSRRSKYADLLVPILSRGKLVYEVPSLEATRAYARRQLEMLSPAIKRLRNASPYAAGLELSLFERKAEMIRRAKREA
jgi:nicotinate phosphoribosyltransferase